MFFGVEKGDLVRRGQLFYKEDEWSISFEAESDHGGADCSIVVVNLNVDFDLSTKKAIGIWGYHPHTMWIQKKLSLPQYFSGSLLFLEKTMAFQDALRLEEALEWKTHYDSASGWLCIGDSTFHEKDIIVEFLSDTLAALNKEKELKALWLKPLFVVNSH